jgi:hypothetical protein
MGKKLRLGAKPVNPHFENKKASFPLAGAVKKCYFLEIK